MKKQLLFLLILMGFCPGCAKYIKVHRTVTKTITVPFTVNATGNFNSVSSITANQITNLFDPDIAGNRGSVLDKMDVNSFNVTGTINEGTNTATQVTVSAFVTTGDPTPLLSDTKLIRIGGNQLVQDAKDILNATTGQISKEISFQNALSAINAVGVKKIQKIITDNLTGVNITGLVIMLNGTVPAGQRLSGSIVLTLNATLTYSRCEVWTTFPLLHKNEC